MYAKEENLLPGHIVQCNLYHRYTNPVSYIFLPVQINSSDKLPRILASQIDFIGSFKRGLDTNEFSEDNLQGGSIFM